MGTVEWLFIVGGIVMIALAAGALGQAPGPQHTLDGVLAVSNTDALRQRESEPGGGVPPVGAPPVRGGRDAARRPW